MTKYYRYNKDGHDIKLKKVGRDDMSRDIYLPISVHNELSRTWWRNSFANSPPGASIYWSGLIPWKDKEEYIAYNACNLPGDMIK